MDLMDKPKDLTMILQSLMNYVSKDQLRQLKLTFSLAHLAHGYDIEKSTSLLEFKNLLLCKPKSKAIPMIQSILMIIEVNKAETKKLCSWTTPSDLQDCEKILCYPRIIVECCKGLKAEEFESIKVALCEDVLDCSADTIENCEDLCLKLHQQQKISDKKLDVLAKFVRNVGRYDIEKKLLDFTEDFKYSIEVTQPKDGEQTTSLQLKEATNHPSIPKSIRLSKTVCASSIVQPASSSISAEQSTNSLRPSTQQGTDHIYSRIQETQNELQVPETNSRNDDQQDQRAAMSQHAHMQDVPSNQAETQPFSSSIIIDQAVSTHNTGERTDFGSEVGSLAGSEDSGTMNYQNTQPINTPPSKNIPRDVIEDDVNVSQLLKELKDYTGATDNDLNRVCSEKHLNKISQQFSYLEELAISLGLKDVQIAEISTKPGASLSFKLKEVLKTWKRNNIAKATYRRLVEVCLDDLRNSIVAEYICGLSKDHVQDGNDDEVSANMLPGQELNELPRSTTCTNCTCYCCSIIISIALVGLITLAAFYFVVPQKKGPPPLEMAAIPQYRTTTKTIPSQMPAYTGKLTGTIITRDDRPNMTQLRSFKLRTGTTIDFVSGIARDYRKVGQLLLKGSNNVDVLEMSSQYQAMDIADRILVDWLSGKGKLPVTWGTLIDVLQECGLSILVYDVEGQLLDLHRDRDEL